MKLSAIIKATAARMKFVRVDVASIRGTVRIVDLKGRHEDIFLQGDDAVTFITEAEQAWADCGDVTMGECYEWQAEQYVDNLWN